MHPPHLQQCEEVYTVVRPPWRGLLTCRLPLVRRESRNARTDHADAKMRPRFVKF